MEFNLLLYLDREMIANQMQLTLDEATTSWGVKVERVEMKDGKLSGVLFELTYYCLVRLPVQLQRAMASEVSWGNLKNLERLETY